MYNLQNSICLALNARIMITTNYWVEAGLFNGATGTIKHVIYADGEKPPCLPITLIIEMDEFYKGPHLMNKPRQVTNNKNNNKIFFFYY